MKTVALISALVLLAFLAVNAWIVSPTRWQWQLQLAATEFGHWLALLLLILMYPAAQSSRWYALVCLLLACIFFIPAMQAHRIAAAQGLQFSWLRLWQPVHTEKFNVQRERRTYPNNNGVHPNPIGYAQIGASFYSWMKASL